MIEHVDRVPTYPGRVALTPVPGQPNKYDMQRADEPLQSGTPQNKLLFDELLAASGVTTGTKQSLMLAQPGFVLFDGATVRFRVHISPSPKVFLDVEGTGPKRVVSPTNENLEGIKEGAYISAVYSAEWDSYVASAGGGGVALSNSINVLEELEKMKYLKIIDRSENEIRIPWLMNFPAQAYGRTHVGDWEVYTRATFGSALVEVRVVKPNGDIVDTSYAMPAAMYAPSGTSPTQCKLRVVPVHNSNHFFVYSWWYTTQSGSPVNRIAFFNSDNGKMSIFQSPGSPDQGQLNSFTTWSLEDASMSAILATDGYVYIHAGFNPSASTTSTYFGAFAPASATGGASIPPSIWNSSGGIGVPLAGGGFFVINNGNAYKLSPWDGVASTWISTTLGSQSIRGVVTCAASCWYSDDGFAHMTMMCMVNTALQIYGWDLSPNQATNVNATILGGFESTTAPFGGYSAQFNVGTKLVFFLGGISAAASSSLAAAFERVGGATYLSWPGQKSAFLTPMTAAYGAMMTVSSGIPTYPEAYFGWKSLCVTGTKLHLLNNGLVYVLDIVDIANGNMTDFFDGYWTCPEDGVYKIIAVGPGAAGTSTFGGGAGYLEIAAREYSAGDVVKYTLGRGQIYNNQWNSVLPTATVFDDIVAKGAIGNRGGYDGGTTTSAGGAGGYDLQKYGGRGMNYVAPTTATNVTTFITANKDRNGGLSANSGAVSSGDGYGAGGGMNLSGNDGCIVIMR